ncbi:MAG: hypothetical protein V4488_07475 [Pseudomonadota bacterium]
MLKIAVASSLALSLVGCASIINDTTHPMRVETKTQSGQMVTGANCKISNDYGSINVKSGDTAQVRRSSKDIDFVCTHPDNPDAVARGISRANAGFAGNILFGGGIGAIIDHNKGTAYTYPTWVQLVFGKSLVFDRRAETEGAPVQAVEAGATLAAGSDAATVTAPAVK